jgi:hypothetical protein
MSLSQAYFDEVLALMPSCHFPVVMRHDGAARREKLMAGTKHLTPDEVAERYRGESSVGAFGNWRAMRIGPAFMKLGTAVLYPVRELDPWDQKKSGDLRASRQFDADNHESVMSRPICTHSLARPSRCARLKTPNSCRPTTWSYLPRLTPRPAAR